MSATPGYDVPGGTLDSTAGQVHDPLTKMKQLAFAFALAASIGAAGGNPPRIAVVRVSDVFRQLETTVKANEEIKVKQAEINRDSRLATYNRLYADLQARRKVLENKEAPLDEETRRRLSREYLLKLQEAKSVFDDFEIFRAERNREIDGEMVTGMKERLALIHATAQRFAKEQGYDWVIDASGNTNTGVPLLLYAKNADDLTGQVLSVLGKAEEESGQASALPEEGISPASAPEVNR